jgi:DNA helicase-2/ATP-dependent DNA helicase PcrA
VSDETVHAALRSDARLVVIEAPAGCGKTHQGAEYAKDVAAAAGQGRPLILTHTHAACSVFAERTRGSRTRVDIRTIDSLIGQIASAYHAGLCLPADTAAWLRRTENGHAELASKVGALLQRHAMIAAAVARRHPVVICDEHQDTSRDQHSIVRAVHDRGAALRVFADPMQRIFGDRAPGNEAGCDWDALTREANAFEALDTPHRWSGGCPELGAWTLAARQSLRDGGTVDLRDGHRPQSVSVVIAENRAQRNLAYQLSAQDRRAIDAFEHQHASLLIMTCYNETALSLRSFFNRRLPLWEGYTRYALDGLVEAIGAANGDCQRLASAVVAFMGEVGIGFNPSAFGNVFEREIREACANTRRGKSAKLQELARLLLAHPDHRGIAAVLRRVAYLAEHDADFSDVKLDCNKEFWDATRLGDFASVEDGLAEITQRRNYARPKPPAKSISIVHKAKGLECDAAALMPCDRSTFPDNGASRCLLYVALSRAKSRLMLVVSRDKQSPLVRI